MSTTFENIYGPQGRTQFLRGIAAPLSHAAIPTHWLRAPIAHLGPLAREVDPALAESFAWSGALVGITLQGWLREWDAEGRVTTHTDWSLAPEILPYSHAVVFSIEDVHGDWEIARRWAGLSEVLVVTEGPRGCTVFVRGQEPRQFPAAVQAEVDPTGAGDIFAAAFFINLYETGDPWGSARLANEVAALSVTRTGLAGVPGPEEVGMCRVRALHASS